MKNVIILIIILIIITGCGKSKVKNVSTNNILENIKSNYPFNNPIEENIKNQSVAERYGISPNDIEEGVVYYTSDNNKSDKIIIVKASSKSKLENIERAISSEIIGITDSWKENEEESKKIEKHVFKTKDLYVFACISDDSKSIEEIFDNTLDGKIKSYKQSKFS